MFFPYLIYIYIYTRTDRYGSPLPKNHIPPGRLKAWTKLRRPVGTVGTEAGETDVFDGHLPGKADGPTWVSVGNHGNHMEKWDI